MKLPTKEQLAERFSSQPIQAIVAAELMIEEYARPLEEENEKLKGDYVIRDLENEIHSLKQQNKTQTEENEKLKEELKELQWRMDGLEK